MHEWYKRKLLQRLQSAWPDCQYVPIDVDEIDTRSWSVLYQLCDSQERKTVILQKAELRRQEKYHEALLPSAFRQEDASVAAVPAPDPVLLVCNPDTVYYNIRPTDSVFQPIKQELSDELQEELNALKSQAQELDEYIPTRWEFEHQSLKMRDKGGSQFKWILENDFLTLSISRGRKTGIIGKARLSSEYLWGYHGDLGRALAGVHVFLTTIFGQRFMLEQAGLDLAADVLYLDMNTLNIKEQFISRAVLDDERPVEVDDGFVDGPSSIKRRWKKLSGLSFGLHTSPVSAVIYNKTHEIKYHSPEKKWMFDLYRARAEQLGIVYTEDMIVWRIEVRFTRPAFREFPDISGAYDVLPHLHDLWTYGVGHPGGDADGLPDGWLRYVMSTEDSNRARWPVHPAWEVVQHAFEEEALPESDYEKGLQVQEELLQEVDEYLKQHPFRRSKYSLEEEGQEELSLPDDLQQEEDILAVFLAEKLLPPPLVDLKPFVRMRKREVNMDRLIAQLAGCLTTLEAWRQGYEEDNPDPVRHDLLLANFVALREIAHYYEERGIDFNEVVEQKRVVYNLVPAA